MSIWHIGQEVVVSGRFNDKRLSHIERFTPAGKIKVAGESKLFHPDGTRRNHGGWGTIYLYAATDKVKQEIWHKDISADLSVFKFHLLDHASLLKINEIVKKFKKENRTDGQL
jgi:hypothetical protein